MIRAHSAGSKLTSILLEISTSITEWREISPFLGLTEAEEHEILGPAPHSVRSQKIEMLRPWKKQERKGSHLQPIVSSV